MATRIYKTAFAATGDTEALASTDPGTGKVSLPTGWTSDYEKADTDPAYRPVGRQEMNGIFNEVTLALGEMQQFGFSLWQSVTGGWPAGAIVAHGGLAYMSAVAANTSTPGADANWVAFIDLLRDIPPVPKSAAYTLALDDRGRSIDTTANVTIPANASVAFPVGSAVMITNTSGSGITIGITSDTLRLAGTANTGTRTLAAYGMATVRKVASTVWFITGAGLS